MSQPNAVSPESALNVLDLATRPENAGKLNRQDYVNIEVSLGVLRELIAASKPAEAPKKE